MDFKKLSEAAKKYERVMEIKALPVKRSEAGLPKKMEIRSPEEEVRRLPSIMKKVGLFLSEKERRKGLTKKELRGLEIPEVKVTGVKLKKRELIDLTKLNIFYSLTPITPRRGQEIYAYANIKWDKNKNLLVYNVVEPNLTKKDKIILDKIKKAIQERLDVDFSKLNVKSAMKYLDQKFNEILEFLRIYPSEKEIKVIKYYVYRDFIGLGKIEPLMHDPYIEDISCDGLGIPLYVYHRNPFIGSVETNVFFKDEDQLDTFVMRLAQKSEKSVSMAEPLVDASLPDGSRIQLTFGTDIAMKGSNFTIRKFTKDPITPIDQMNEGSIDSRMLAYLWFCIEHGKSMLISGGTATGKTTLLNVLSMFIKPSMKIISIEDTPELRFSHPHWVPEVARQALSEVKGKKMGQVDLFDLLKESLRQRPDYIIVGEVRGKEAYVLFQQMATGHPGLSTIHAESMSKLIDRLTTEPISLPPSLIENLDVILFLSRIKRGDKYVRRIKEIVEMEKYDIEKEKVDVNTVFKWDPVNDAFKSSGSILLEKISEQTGQTEESIKKEIKTRAMVLEWGKKIGIGDYRNFGKIVRMYYANSEKLMKKVKGLE
ncbi:MAG: type II/IV secretion system ATPase subunit [archaeon]|nr:MAG: type II/IV secretion system ATPase subunit [archaeon]